LPLFEKRWLRMPKTHSLSHTAASSFMTCNRKYFYQYILGIQKLGNTPGRRRGGAMALAQEHWDTDVIDGYYEAIIDDLDNLDYVGDLEKEREIVRIMAEGYMRVYRKPDQVEVAFTTPIVDTHGNQTDYWNRGYIDAVEVQGGSHVLIENKLLSMWTHAHELALQLDAQSTRYIDAARTLLKLNVPHLLYRVTKWPGIRQTAKDGSLNGYLTRLREEVNADIEAKAGKYFLEFKLMRSDAQLVDFRESLSALAEIIKGQAKKELWPLNPGNACAAYGGCDFLALCRQDQGAAELYEHRNKSNRPEEEAV